MMVKRCPRRGNNKRIYSFAELEILNQAYPSYKREEYQVNSETEYVSVDKLYANAGFASICI